ncbi:MAG: hypothetical protein ACREVA_09590, partial [Burkholderiales bacterium]
MSIPGWFSEDRNGNRTSYQYDSTGRLATITDPVSRVTRFDYVNDYLNTVTDPSGRSSRFAHDAAGNLLAVTFPDGTRITHEYDSRHLMTGHQDER